MPTRTKEIKQVKRILGIDPGTNAMGYAIIDAKGDDIKLIALGVLKIPSGYSQALKLKKIYHQVAELITEYGPDDMAIEAPFFGKNVQSMLKLGRAQGVAIVAAVNKAINVTEYSPKSIKQSVTGNGNASKAQVAGVLAHILKRSIPTKSDDATDALGAAVCHHFKGDNRGGGKSYTGWKDFAKQNTKRTKE